MPTATPLVATLLAALLSAAEPPPCTLPHAAEWLEYRSPRVVLVTDASRPAATALLKELEYTRVLVLQAIFGEQVEIPGTLRVVAYRDPAAFEAVAGKDVAGFFMLDRMGEPLVVLQFDGSGPVPGTVAHELTHQISWHYFTRQPRWFSEGLARFIQTVAVPRQADAPVTGSLLVRGIRGSGGRYAGLATKEMLQDLALSGGVPARELLAWTGELDGAVPGRFHAASWRLYHWLWNERSAAFTDYQARLSRAEDPAAAWRAAFPELDPDKPGALEALDEMLRRYGGGGRYLAYRVEAQPPELQVQVAQPGSAELHLLLADARRIPFEGQAARAALQLEAAEEALREDPGHPVATWLKGRSDKATLAAPLRAAVAARPEDWRGAYLLAGLLKTKEQQVEREALLRRAAALAPGAAAVQNDLAWLLVTSGRAKEARRFAEQAIDLAPWRPAIVDTLAVVASEIGQCTAALQLAHRAADLSGNGATASEALRDRVMEIGSTCKPAAPARP